MGDRFFIIAGEASGDLHAAKLIHEIKKIKPLVSFKGIGGPAMASEGMSSIVSLSKMAVMGFWEVLSNLYFLKKIESKVLSELAKGGFEALILVDYPGFNLRIAKKIKKIKPTLPVFFYISPQLWAWKENRLESVKKYVDKMIVFFPFEKKWYQDRGVQVDFVGHPFADSLANISKPDCKKRLGLSKNKNYLTLYPGSRHQEINSHLPVMLSALKDDYFKNFEILLGCAPTIKEDFLRRFDLSGVRIIQKNSIDALACANFAWVGSGTSTLESVFFKTPTIIVYKTSFFSWHMIRFLSSVRFAGMPNIILNEEIMPELLQNDFTARNLIDITKKYFNNKDFSKSMMCGYEKIISSLGAPGASKRAAKAIVYDG